MSLLIDGYNLLHATDLFGEGKLAGTLQGAREALLAYLVDRLTASERSRTTIVFDAAAAPPGLPDHYRVEGIHVRYARGYPDADTLIEQLIETWQGPKGLTVVSSDHRVQRAARSRGAAYCNSQSWRRELHQRRGPSPDEPARPTTGLEPPEFWIQQFTDHELLDRVTQVEAELRSAPSIRGVAPAESQRPQPRKQPFGEGILDPFPPGYADDLAQELDDPPDEDP